MSIYSDAPELWPFRRDKPTLLVCWWATSFCALMILLRIAGRFIRTERLFLEDRIAALALIPLIMRMACVHFILIFGTNNADFTNVDLTDTQIHQKSVASGLVLASRFFYAATLWILKLAILEFLRRLTGLTWERSHQTTLIAIRWILLVTFIVVIISDLAECQPFRLYWQVVPDPGGHCRQGYAQLITMASCNIFTDLLLVFFPIPIILRSQMSIKRKIQLVLLFSLSLPVVGVTIYRIPRTLEEQGRQQFRSLMASVELIFATAAANALVLGSFVRDRGVKKQKFRRNSAADSFDRSSGPRRPTFHRQWGSDEDLVRDVGLSIDPELRQRPMHTEGQYFAPAPMVPQAERNHSKQRGHAMHSDESLLQHEPLAKSNSTPGRSGLSFLDVGGLLDSSVGSSSGSYRRGSYTSSTPDPSSPRVAPPATVPAGTSGVRRGSTALLQDLGGLLSPLNTRSSKMRARNETELQPIPQSRSTNTTSSHKSEGMELMDPGGLLK
ncbi:hypothetical protein JDV02_007563 [Purpureocillium takamizusanense]|uniref:Rhodopsin domain-containing protein n=1 Tax=Purpureocillium takamizusanense TaxID=2060973 RepID=A0A9Q8VDE9_9HYPO|nr:uncharacterized protein JDV02_007563 [Purpureocillium takamizusanense]UNI21588.1 hypothetical protein JDV02_007563 [Purpureocillium takamizusanense]